MGCFECVKGELGVRVLVEVGGGWLWSVVGERCGVGECGGGMGDG